MILTVTLDTFEGPLDLLLQSARTHEVDLSTIPLAPMTKQALDALGGVRPVDLEVAGEFLVIAATLLYLKSKTLLPPEETEVTENEEEASPPGLAQHLLEYQQYKEAADEFSHLQAQWQLVYARPMAQPQEEAVTLHRVGLADLLEAFKAVLEHATVPEPLELARDEDTVERRCVWLLGRLGRRTRIPFAELFSADETRLGVITTFLALLELIRRRLAMAVQDRPFGSIFICRTEETGRHA